MKQGKSIYDDYKKLNDQELVYRYAHRNEYAAVYHLFDRYGHLVFGICMRYINDADTARNTMQTIFINLLTDLKRFNVPEFKPWLFNYVKNHCVIQAEGELQVIGNEITNYNSVEFAKIPPIESDATLNLLVDVLDNMDQDERHCIELFYYKKMNYGAIAQKTGFTYDEVYSMIRAAKRQLKVKLLETTGRKEI